MVNVMDSYDRVLGFLDLIGYNWATLFLGDISTGNWPSRLGESQYSENEIWL
jgi:hypothetical protein